VGNNNIIVELPYPVANLSIYIYYSNSSFIDEFTGVPDTNPIGQVGYLVGNITSHLITLNSSTLYAYGLSVPAFDVNGTYTTKPFSNTTTGSSTSTGISSTTSSASSSSAPAAVFLGVVSLIAASLF
jgi:hypothetical protein